MIGQVRCYFVVVCSCYQAARQMQQLEEERISAMRDALDKYNSHLSVVGPKLIKVHMHFTSHG